MQLDWSFQLGRFPKPGNPDNPDICQPRKTRTNTVWNASFWVAQWQSCYCVVCSTVPLPAVALSGGNLGWLSHSTSDLSNIRCKRNFINIICEIIFNFVYLFFKWAVCEWIACIQHHFLIVSVQAGLTTLSRGWQPLRLRVSDSSNRNTNSKVGWNQVGFLGVQFEVETFLYVFKCVNINPKIWIPNPGFEFSEPETRVWAKRLGLKTLNPTFIFGCLEVYITFKVLRMISFTTTVKPVFFACPLFREFRDPDEFAKITGREYIF